MGNVEPPRVIPVEIDEAALKAEAAALAASAPAPDIPNSSPPSGVEADPAAGNAPAAGEPPPAVDVNARAADVEPAVCMLVEQAAKFIAPAWQVTAEESAQVGKPLALVLAYWMPDDAIEPKYLALLSLAGAVWGVASKRRDESGAFRPLRAPKVQQAPAKEAAPPVNPTLGL